MSPLANALKAAMEQRGWSQVALSERSDVPKQTLSNILTDKNQGPPELTTLAKLASALEISIGSLIIAADRTYPEPGSQAEIHRIATLLQLMPWLATAVNRMAELPEAEVQALLAYMEIHARQKDQG